MSSGGTIKSRFQYKYTLSKFVAAVIRTGLFFQERFW